MSKGVAWGDLLMPVHGERQKSQEHHKDDSVNYSCGWGSTLCQTGGPCHIILSDENNNDKKDSRYLLLDRVYLIHCTHTRTHTHVHIRTHTYPS